jgi:LCP family protein required for cell wall assembly
MDDYEIEELPLGSDDLEEYELEEYAIEEFKERRVKKHSSYSRNKKRRRKRIIIIAAEVFACIILSISAYAMTKLNKINYKELNEDNLEVQNAKVGYTNVAVFGLDCRVGESMLSGVRSDTIIIASLNNATNEVKLISVLRDTLMDVQNANYDKANHAYYEGGPEMAIAMLNKNLDLDIQKFVSVNFTAVADVIDILGGIDIDMTAEEAYWTNGYIRETKAIVGRETPYMEETAGVKHLDGVSAVAFSRIRFTAGNDVKRTERQRLVLEKMLEKAKAADFGVLNKIIDTVFPQIYTNFTISEIMDLATDVTAYNITDTSRFPFVFEYDDNVTNHPGSFVVAADHITNVRELHRRLYPDDAYEPSHNINTVTADVKYLTGVEAQEIPVESPVETPVDSSAQTSAETPTQ